MDSARAHAVLGVHATTPLAEVRKRFRARARMLHPDAVGDERLRTEAEFAFIELNTAWELIQDLDSKGQRHFARTVNGADPAGATTGTNAHRPTSGEADSASEPAAKPPKEESVAPDPPRRPSHVLGSSDVDDVRFTPVRIREGYDMGEVDRFLDESRATIHFYESKASSQRPSKLLKETDIATKRFTPVRLREGYDMGEVDAFLDKLQASVAWHEINS